MELLYSDNTDLVYVKDGSETRSESGYIRNYIATSAQISAERQWKSSGYGARFRGETAEVPEETRIDAFVNGLTLYGEGQALYDFSVNEISGLYKKDFTAEKQPEAHVIHANNREFHGLSSAGTRAAVSVKTDYVNAHIATLDPQSGDYRIVTGGDSRDMNPTFSARDRNVVLYDTAGVGRDYSGNFAAYSDAYVCAIDLENLRVTDLAEKKGVSLIKPKDDAAGNLYYIEKPTNFKPKSSNLFIDILLIPFRILQAVYRFLETFVMLFTGKTFTSHDSNPTKGRERDGRQIVIDGNLVNVDKEFKRNCRNAGREAGIIPKSWQLIRRRTDGTETVLTKGVTAYEVLSGGTIVYTNGRGVYALSPDGKTEKLAAGKLILHLAVREV